MQLYALSASAVPAAAPGERVCLQLLLQMPSCSMLATPLYTKRLCHVPLAEALLKPGGMTAWQVGMGLAVHACVHMPVRDTMTVRMYICVGMCCFMLQLL